MAARSSSAEGLRRRKSLACSVSEEDDLARGASWSGEGAKVQVRARTLLDSDVMTRCCVMSTAQARGRLRPLVGLPVCNGCGCARDHESCCFLCIMCDRAETV